MNIYKQWMYVSRDFVAIMIYPLKLAHHLLLFLSGIVLIAVAVSEEHGTHNIRTTRGVKERIVGGEEATPHQFPFIVELRDGAGHWCGGSILTPEHILTAAHCLDRHSASSFEVVGGEHRLNQDDGTEQRRRGLHEVVHEDFVLSIYNNDIAIISLDKPFQFNENVKPIRLPEAGFEPTSMATVMGWGRTSYQGSSPAVLLKVEVPLVSDQECRRKYENVRPTAVCYGYPEGGKDSCQGDSGGPLVCGDGDNRVQCGIVSNGKECARSGYPGIYTEVSHYIGWIKTHVKDIQKDNVNLTKITSCGGYYETHTVKITLANLPAGQRCLLVVQSQFNEVTLKLADSNLKKDDGLYATKIWDTETADHVKIEEVAKDYVLKGGGVILITLDISATTDPSDKRSIVLEFSSGNGGKDSSPPLTSLRSIDTATPGSFAYPALEAAYGNNESVLFTLSPSDSGVKDVTLTFTLLDIEPEGAMCNSDAVTVWAFRDGTYTMESRLCGTKIPKKIVLPGGIGLVTFVSDGTFVRKGFSFDYT